MENDDLIPVFIPALSAILINAEDKKEAPLVENEVLDIRDKASVIMMQKDSALKMHESREYVDIDPENCWYEWQMLRRELGRKPDIDPGVKFSYVKSSDDEYKKTISMAQETLSDFRELMQEREQNDIFPLVKVLLEEPQYRAFMWLTVTSYSETEFEVEIFELPSDFAEYKVGDSLCIKNNEIQDWMINDDGVLFGGFSLRYNRSTMSEQEQVTFDEHLGVNEYA